jgi:hypothetical protein
LYAFLTFPMILYVPPCHFLHLHTNILLSSMFSSTINLWSSLSVTEQVQMPYQIIVAKNSCFILCIF